MELLDNTRHGLKVCAVKGVCLARRTERQKHLKNRTHLSAGTAYKRDRRVSHRVLHARRRHTRPRASPSADLRHGAPRRSERFVVAAAAAPPPPRRTFFFYILSSATTPMTRVCSGYRTLRGTDDEHPRVRRARTCATSCPGSTAIHFWRGFFFFFFSPNPPNIFHDVVYTLYARPRIFTFNENNLIRDQLLNLNCSWKTNLFFDEIRSTRLFFLFVSSIVERSRELEFISANERLPKHVIVPFSSLSLITFEITVLISLQSE